MKRLLIICRKWQLMMLYVRWWWFTRQWTKKSRRVKKIMDDHQNAFSLLRTRAKGLERRVEELEPALAECVAALRKISVSGPEPGTAPRSRYWIAKDTLDHLQIPDDHLPTKGYPATTK